MNVTEKYFFSFIGAFLSAIIIASFFSIQTTSLQVARLEEKMEAIKSNLAITETRHREMEDRLKILEAKK